MKRLVAGAALVGCGLLLHLIEPVSALDCRRDAPGPAACTISRSFYGAIPWERTGIAAAAVAADDERLGRADPEAVTCTGVTLLDTQGDSAPFACLRDAAAVARARAYFAVGSADRELRLRHSEGLVLAVSGAFTIAGALLLATAPFRRSRPASAARPPSRAGPPSRS